MTHELAGALQQASRIRQCCAVKEPHAYVRGEYIDVAEGRISQTGNRTAIMQKLPDFVSALSHHLKPPMRDGSQFTGMLFQPRINGGIPLDSAVESQQVRFHRRWRLVSIRPGVSRLLKKACLDLVPGDDIGRVLFMPGDPVIQLGALRVGERCRVRFQAFPHGIQQLRFLGGGEVAYLLKQIAHMPLLRSRHRGRRIVDPVTATEKREQSSRTPKRPPRKTIRDAEDAPQKAAATKAREGGKFSWYIANVGHECPTR
jgi:hypothetical protein